jgi:cysteine synthase B
VEISTEETYAMIRRLAREEGLLVGLSGAAAVVGSLKVAKSLPKDERAVIVTVIPDSADKYLSERFWDEPEDGGYQI